MSTFLRTSIIATSYYRMLQNYLLEPLQRSGLTHNQMTLIGVFIAIMVPFGFLLHPIVGLLLLVASGISDSMDGFLARQQNRVSPFGAFLDSSLDRLSDVFYLAGFWLLLWPHPWRLLATLLMFAALLLTLMISYVKSRAEALGLNCQVGIMERGVRVIYVIAWALLLVLLPSARSFFLWFGFIAYTGLTSATLLQRMLYIRREIMFPVDPLP